MFRFTSRAFCSVVVFVLFLLLIRSASSEAAPTSEDRTWGDGEIQLNRVLRDRPQLVSVVKKGSPIWLWLVQNFQDTKVGFKIQWDSEPPQDGYDNHADSSAYPDENNISYIRLGTPNKGSFTTGKVNSTEQLLGELVFELCNVRLGQTKRTIEDRLEHGDISRREYILECASMEYLADTETAGFYNSIWVPYCKTLGWVYDPSLWHVSEASNFREWMKQYPPNSWYPWQYYGNRYDGIIYQRAGDSNLCKGDVKGAITNYTTALNLGSQCYYSRGIAELAGHEWENALSDIHRAENSTRNSSEMKNRYHALYWLLEMLKGEKESEADTRLKQYLADSSSLNSSDWMASIALYLISDLNQNELLERASLVGSKQNLQRLCDAYYYIGMRHLLTGDTASSTYCFQKVISTGRNDQIEYLLAWEELARAQGR